MEEDQQARTSLPETFQTMEMEARLDEHPSPASHGQDLDVAREALETLDPRPSASPAALDRQAKLKQALMVQMEMQKHLHHQLAVSSLSGAWAWTSSWLV